MSLSAKTLYERVCRVQRRAAPTPWTALTGGAQDLYRAIAHVVDEHIDLMAVDLTAANRAATEREATALRGQLEEARARATSLSVRCSLETEQALRAEVARLREAIDVELAAHANTAERYAKVGQERDTAVAEVARLTRLLGERADANDTVHAALDEAGIVSRGSGDSIIARVQRLIADANEQESKLDVLRVTARALLGFLDRFKSYEAAPGDVVGFCNAVLAVRAEVEKP